MARGILGLVLLLGGCAKEELTACADVPLELCTSTPGCDVLEAFVVVPDEVAERACWDDTPRAVTCEPAFDDGRCVVSRTFAMPEDGGDCRWFTTTCIPEGWVVCEQLPTNAVCPVCADEALPPWQAPDREVGDAVDGGRSVAVGDLDGDGVPDLVFGAGASGAWIVFGPGGPGIEENAATRDTQTDSELVVAVGDLTGDGQDDLVLASPRATKPPSTERRGAVWVFPGPIVRETIDVEDAPIRIEGERVGDELGASVGLGDIDGDGQLDLVSWARDAATLVADGGRLDVFLGPLPEGSYGPEGAAARIAGAGDFGRTWTVGDLDGDTVPELLVGDVARQVRAFESPLVGNLVASDGVLLDARVLGGTSEPVGALAVGDVDGDGIDDLVVGVPTQEGGGVQRGEVLVVSGPIAVEDGRLEPAPLLAGRCDADLSGAALAITDLDGDGVADLLVGLGSRVGSSVGGLLVAGPLGSVSGLVSAGATRLGDGAWSGGVVVADVDGDGVPDLAAGDLTEGNVKVFFGVP